MGFWTSAALITAAVVSAGTGVASAATAGGGEGGGRKKLSPEDELKMIADNEQATQENAESMENLRAAETALNERYDVAQGILENTIPPEAQLKALNQSSVKLAQALGNAGIDAASGGFLDSEDRAEIEKLQTMDIENPKLEAQIKEDRMRVQQQAIAQGMSPDQVDRMMQKFDERAEGRRSDESQRLVERRAGLLELKEGLRKGSYDRSLGGFDALGTEIERAREGAGGLANLAGARFNATSSTEDRMAALRGERLERFRSMGDFDLSSQTLDALESGAVGPGSFYQQTGISRNEQDNYRGSVSQREDQVSQWDIDMRKNPAPRSGSFDAWQRAQRAKGVSTGRSQLGDLRNLPNRRYN